MSSNQGELWLHKRYQTGHARLKVVEGCSIIWVYHFGNRRWVQKKPNWHKGRARYNFPPGRTVVYRNRAVWIIANNQLVPEGYFVDHKDQDKTNDNPDNLQLHTMSESHKQGMDIYMDRSLKEICDWFTLQGWLCT